LESLRGRLLIASPALLDPNFRRTIVLVAEHGEEGALGLVLKRPSEVEVADAAPALADLVEPDAVVFVGGPVAPNALLVLAELDDAHLSAGAVAGDVGFVRADADPALVSASARRARVYAGYAGWSSEQLDLEFEQDSWIVEDAVADDIFAEPEELWPRVVRRKGGPYALLATMPVEPSLN
jgi:putative transcriptional regulator